MGSTECSSFDVADESNYDLIEMVSWQQTDEDVAKAAWMEFYRRHYEYIYYLLFKKTNGDTGLASDITQDTFLKIYENAYRSFKVPETSDGKEQQHVRLWVGKIAQNLLWDYYKAYELETSDENIEDYGYSDQHKTEIEPENTALANKVREIFENHLSDRERAVLDLALSYDDPQNQYSKIPKKELDAVCKNWGITSVNFRQIKKRAITKIKEKMTEKLVEAI